MQRTWFGPLLFVIYTLSQKRTKFETVYLKIIKIVFDEVWLRCSKDSRYSSHVLVFM